MLSLSGLLESVSLAKKLALQVFDLTNSQAVCSTEEFAFALHNFELEVDKISKLLADQFGDDPRVMQVISELKSAVDGLKTANVETSSS